MTEHRDLFPSDVWDWWPMYIMITQLTKSAQLYLKLLKTESSVILFVRFTYFKHLACMYVCVLMCMYGGCGD